MVLVSHKSLRWDSEKAHLPLHDTSSEPQVLGKGFLQTESKVRKGPGTRINENSTVLELP